MRYCNTQPSVIPLSEAIKEVIQELDDREWRGDFSRSAMLFEQLQHLQKLEAKGDVWYPLF